MGSIRRKVRGGKSGQSSSTISIPEAAFAESTKNQDDFLKAAMKIFLVVSPPMGRVQVRSRSLTQLDALAMMDKSEQRSSDPVHQAEQQSHQQPQQPQQQHQQPANLSDYSPRLLVPNASSSKDSSRLGRTRHKLSRSQVSSSEYFSISFEIGIDTGVLDREEFLPANQGHVLAEVLSGACERRGVDLNHVDVYLESIATPLPIYTTETSFLGGKHLRITAKDDKAISRSASQRSAHRVSLRKTASCYKGRSGRFFSMSTEDSSADSEITSGAIVSSGKSSAGLKASKQRWSGFFANTKGTKMDVLSDILDSYLKHGIPRVPDTQTAYDLSASEEAPYFLENDWRSIVLNSEQLSEKHQQQQTALWELIHTEVAYIRTLKVVTDLFMSCIYAIQEASILVEIDRTKLFGNIQEIYAANSFFWKEHLLVMLNAARATGKPLNPSDLFRGFESFEKIFAPYTRYCSEQSNCQQYCKDRRNDNEVFTAYLTWCEASKDCNRLRLWDILVMPMQRLTKYSLLLNAVYKNTERVEQCSELISMIKSVDNFVTSVNAAVKRNQEIARLKNIAARLETYDVVESRDEELDKLIKMYSNFDIVNAAMPGCPKEAFRTLLREGDLKLRDAVTSKMEVRVLLLTDLLLICKQSTKKTTGGGLRVVRQPYIVDRIRVHELKEPSSLGLIYLNEYGAASAALIFSAGESRLAKSWMDSLKKAQQQYEIMKHPPPNASALMSKQISTAFVDGDFGNDEYEGTLRTPRGSSRASRVSSLAHSHSGDGVCSSGSMEMEGVSPGSNNFLSGHTPSRNVSVETTEQTRASSVSSEEGPEYGSSYAKIRRALLSKSPTPNTLSVQVPAYSCLGQSLPNLTLATSPQTSTVSPTPPNSLLIVPQITKSKDTLLSPGQRGISYPPPSPPRGALRRAFAIPQSRNPPLIKTRHLSASLATSQITTSLDTEANEERRKRLDASQRMQSTSSIVEEKVLYYTLRFSFIVTMTSFF